jgi:heme a synthase
MRSAQSITTSPWPHRWAVVLACATFPLLWVGGLVTTTDAGMAVPDWPTTFGYNPFLYPLSTWLFGPWDVFVEHGHRLFGSLVGLLTIILLVVIWRIESRRWVRGLGAAALVLVIFQGALGGMRVQLNERGLAMIHGIVGPLFFATTVSLVIFTSAAWRNCGTAAIDIGAGHIRRLAVVTCILVYLQMMIGAVLRHVPVAAEPGTFLLAVKLHLALAGILSLHVVALVWSIVRRARSLGRFALLLCGVLVAQLALGAGTWFVKYSVPAWAVQYVPFNRTAIVDGGWLQTHIVTAHVALGSLLLATTLSLALFTWRRSAVRLSQVREAQLTQRGAIA